jgi:predicted DNA-binding transcriptional regulator AlpA
MTVSKRKERQVTPNDGWAKGSRQTASAWLDAPLWSRARVLLAYGGRSVSWLYAEMAARRVPRPVRIGRNSVAWVAQQVRDDIAAKIAVGPVELTAKPKSSIKSIPSPTTGPGEPLARSPKRLNV